MLREHRFGGDIQSASTHRTVILRMEYRHCSEQPAVEFQFEGSNRLGCDIILDYINTD